MNTASSTIPARFQGQIRVTVTQDDLKPDIWPDDVVIVDCAEDPRHGDYVLTTGGRVALYVKGSGLRRKMLLGPVVKRISLYNGARLQAGRDAATKEVAKEVA